jgi:putative oxidoreductase
MSSLIVKLRALTLAIGRLLTWLPPLLARLGLGFMFIEAGLPKVRDPEKFVPFFAPLGIPSPEHMVPFVGGTEVVCGALLIAGLATRVASVPLLVTMVVALITAHGPEAGWAGVPLRDAISHAVQQDVFAIGVVMLFLFVHGPGPLSLDRLLAPKLPSPEDERKDR